MDFVTHVPAPELQRSPAFVRVPSALERKHDGLPDLPGERTKSRSVLQRSQELALFENEGMEYMRSGEESREKSGGKYAYHFCVLNANSPYRRSNQFKAQMHLPKSAERTGKSFYGHIDGNVQRVDHTDFDVNDAALTGGSRVRGTELRSNIYSRNRKSENGSKARVATTLQPVDFCARYGLPQESTKKVIKSGICDFDENTYQSIPFSGSIRVDRYMRKNGIRPLQRNSPAMPAPVVNYNDFSAINLFE